jgi:hypothetical protein
MRFRKPYKPNNWFLLVQGLFLMMQMAIPAVGYCMYLPKIGDIAIFLGILFFMIIVLILFPLGIGYLILKNKKGAQYAKLYYTAQQ